MIQALLWVHLFVQMQVAGPQVTPEVSTLLQSGSDAESHNQFDQAIVDFRKAADLDPSSAAILLRLGDAYVKKRDYPPAITTLKRAAELSPDSLPIHQLLGYALLSDGYAAQAIPHLEIAHDSGAMGIAQLQADQPAEAIVNLRVALSKNPNDPDLLYYLSRAGAALSSQSEDKLLSSFPEDARALEILGQHYYAMKMLPQAIKEYEQAIALRPELPGLRLELGQIYAARSDWAQAEKQFRDEAKLQSGNPEAAYRLGETLLQEGKMKEAAEELRRSDLLRPNMPETLYSLARATAVSNPASAEVALKRIIEIEKETPLAGQAYLLLAAIHRKQGNAELATREMAEYHRIQTLTSRDRE